MSDLDHILALMKKYTFDNTNESELGEQDEAGASTASAGGGAAYPTVTKWETGLTRSVANTIDDKVTWKSLNKLARGKANTLL
jgi:hypothetical protein